MTKLRILGKLAHAIFLYPDQRVGQIISNAIGRHSAANASDTYYISNDDLLHVLREYNREAL